MFTATLQPLPTQFSPADWRCPDCFNDLTPDHHTRDSLRILEDRDREENGPSFLFHG
ncbi:MAG TPA: hypothetical protein VFA04_09900 [Bryobacteraceae bacterium]|nr:hypothetical protein [Bryobacteraceae bacterium]